MNDVQVVDVDHREHRCNKSDPEPEPDPGCVSYPEIEVLEEESEKIDTRRQCQSEEISGGELEEQRKSTEELDGREKFKLSKDSKDSNKNHVISEKNNKDHTHVYNTKLDGCGCDQFEIVIKVDDVNELKNKCRNPDQCLYQTISARVDGFLIRPKCGRLSVLYACADDFSCNLVENLKFQIKTKFLDIMIHKLNTPLISNYVECNFYELLFTCLMTDRSLSQLKCDDLHLNKSGGDEDITKMQLGDCGQKGVGCVIWNLYGDNCTDVPIANWENDIQQHFLDILILSAKISNIFGSESPYWINEMCDTKLSELSSLINRTSGNVLSFVPISIVDTLLYLSKEKKSPDDVDDQTSTNTPTQVKIRTAQSDTIVKCRNNRSSISLGKLWRMSIFCTQKLIDRRSGHFDELLHKNWELNRNTLFNFDVIVHYQALMVHLSEVMNMNIYFLELFGIPPGFNLNVKTNSVNRLKYVRRCDTMSTYISPLKKIIYDANVKITTSNSIVFIYLIGKFYMLNFKDSEQMVEFVDVFSHHKSNLLLDDNLFDKLASIRKSSFASQSGSRSHCGRGSGRPSEPNSDAVGTSFNDQLDKTSKFAKVIKVDDMPKEPLPNTSGSSDCTISKLATIYIPPSKSTSKVRDSWFEREFKPPCHVNIYDDVDEGGIAPVANGDLLFRNSSVYRSHGKSIKFSKDCNLQYSMYSMPNTVAVDILNTHRRAVDELGQISSPFIKINIVQQCHLVKVYLIMSNKNLATQCNLLNMKPGIFAPLRRSDPPSNFDLNAIFDECNGTFIASGVNSLPKIFMEKIRSDVKQYREDLLKSEEMKKMKSYYLFTNVLSIYSNKVAM